MRSSDWSSDVCSSDLIGVGKGKAIAQPSVKQGDVEAGIANKLFYLGIFLRVRKVERRGRVAVDAVLPIRIPSAKINRNGIGKRNPCFSIFAEIAVGIAFVAAQTFLQIGNANGTEKRKEV